MPSQSSHEPPKDPTGKSHCQNPPGINNSKSAVWLLPSNTDGLGLPRSLLMSVHVLGTRFPRMGCKDCRKGLDIVMSRLCRKWEQRQKLLSSSDPEQRLESLYRIRDTWFSAVCSFVPMIGRHRHCRWYFYCPFCYTVLLAQVPRVARGGCFFLMGHSYESFCFSTVVRESASRLLAWGDPFLWALWKERVKSLPDPKPPSVGLTQLGLHLRLPVRSERCRVINLSIASRWFILWGNEGASCLSSWFSQAPRTHACFPAHAEVLCLNPGSKRCPFLKWTLHIN